MVGYLTSHMLQQGNDSFNEEFAPSSLPQQEKAQALAFNIFLLSTFFWALCGLFWAIMYWLYPKDRNDLEDKVKTQTVELKPLVE